MRGFPGSAGRLTSEPHDLGRENSKPYSIRGGFSALSVSGPPSSPGASSVLSDLSCRPWFPALSCVGGLSAIAPSPLSAETR